MASSEDLLEQRRKATKDIAYRLPEISQNYFAFKAAQDAAQQALDRLNVLQAEEKIYLTAYGEKEAERCLALAKEETAKHRIGEIETSLLEIQQEQQILHPQQEEATKTLAMVAEEQTRLYNQSKPLDQCIKELESQKGSSFMIGSMVRVRFNLRSLPGIDFVLVWQAPLLLSLLLIFCGDQPRSSRSPFYQYATGSRGARIRGRGSFGSRRLGTIYSTFICFSH